MRILVLYTINDTSVRNTVLEHLYAFKKYAPEAKFHYCNVRNRVPRCLASIHYDGIILHYTFLSRRFALDTNEWKELVSGIGALKGHKVAIPQDEYDATDKLCYLFKEHGVKTVCTCFHRKEDYLKAYPPEQTGIQYYIPVLTGYVDEEAVAKIEAQAKPYNARLIDIGYRSRKLPYYFGKHSQLKTRIAEVFKKKLKNIEGTYDIANTGGQGLTFFGKDWYAFLLRCKAFLGCEGGASMIDRTGEIRKKVEAYTAKKPDSSFEEVEENCFPGQDHTIECFTFSPRHFEAIITKTCQVLVEGNYSGVLNPHEHYIPVKKDFSDIDKVLTLLKDEKYCQKIIDTAYDDIILKGEYTYRKFAYKIVTHIAAQAGQEDMSTEHNEFNYNLAGYYLSATNALYAGIIYPLRKTGLIKLIQKNKRVEALARKLYKKT
jgi:hypothetical protein